jgi:hypothetical protein
MEKENEDENKDEPELIPISKWQTRKFTGILQKATAHEYLLLHSTENS